MKDMWTSLPEGSCVQVFVLVSSSSRTGVLILLAPVVGTGSMQPPKRMYLFVPSRISSIAMKWLKRGTLRSPMSVKESPATSYKLEQFALTSW